PPNLILSPYTTLFRSKIVGFEVMPRTPRSTQRASSPPVIQLRRRLSSQGLCPCSWYSRGAWSRVLLQVVDELSRPGHHVVGREAEAGERDVARRGGAVAVEGQAVVGPA